MVHNIQTKDQIGHQLFQDHDWTVMNSYKTICRFRPFLAVLHTKSQELYYYYYSFFLK